ncbi:MAG: molybdenum cofactor biosynthesis protein MoeB [Candidatus Omnitrophica bacterium CG11_big_fil_rev_8_21_14_0_20_64_10]|nr:MAG: molybdenum cofactor biosynthesis protein MoeB [Candidatus Omnitrophica bacterium CG11_big_fil_rev_8_21_14_0_20_64_10]
MSLSGNNKSETTGIPVYIPTALQRFVGQQETIRLSGQTVGEVLAALVGTHPELKAHLYADETHLRSFVNVFLNDEDIRSAQGLATPVQPTDQITIVPSIAGGAGAKLSNDEIKRYSRHLIMPEVGMAGQEKLKAASVLLIGTGGLGSPLGLYLASAGIGRIGLVDFDVIDFTNLQRQVLYNHADIGRPKVQVAAERLRAINPYIKIEAHETRLNSENALELLKNYDIIVDGTDNFPTRYLTNDACVLLGKPNVYGSIFRFEGQASVFDAKNGPCYRCLYPEPPPPGLVPSCAEGGVLGILPGIVGTIQATETIKLIIGGGETLTGRLLLFNALKMKFRELKLRKAADCPLCGKNPTITKLIDYQEFCGLRGQETPAASQPQAADNGALEITPEDLKKLLDQKKPVKIIDVREPHEYDICRIEGARLIPLSEFSGRLDEMDPADELVLLCHHGMRSLKALKILKEAGFKKARSLAGGIDAWSERIDDTVPRY